MRDVNAFLTLKQSEGAPGQIEEWAKLEENYNKKYVSFIQCLKVYVLNCLPIMVFFTLSLHIEHRNFKLSCCVKKGDQIMPRSHLDVCYILHLLEKICIPTVVSISPSLFCIKLTRFDEF